MEQRPLRKILIVEDDPDSNDALAKILRIDGWMVYQARNVREALHLLKSKPDCVLLDRLLPDGDGIEVLTALRDVERLDSNVIIITGAEDDTGIGALWAKHIIGYLKKPVDFHELFFLLKQR